MEPLHCRYATAPSGGDPSGKSNPHFLGENQVSLPLDDRAMAGAGEYPPQHHVAYLLQTVWRSSSPSSAKATYFGAAGAVRSVMPASWGVRPPLRWLQA
jgi:hypothetical protein